jgi:hypothetical protein
VENLDSGRAVKHKCLQNNIRQKVEGTNETLY